MKRSTLLILVLIFTHTVQAQHVFNPGSVKFNAGIGVPQNNGYIPTVNISGEVGVIQTGTIGLVSFGGLAEFHLADDGKTFPRFYAGPRAAWHLHAFNSLVFDVYAGAGFGIVINGQGLLDRNTINVQADMFVGGRWMFSPGAGLFAELGMTGFSNARFGITFGF